VTTPVVEVVKEITTVEKLPPGNTLDETQKYIYYFAVGVVACVLFICFFYIIQRGGASPRPTFA